MSGYLYRGFYPAHYDTPTGSRYVQPGEEVDWPDGPPDNWWTPLVPEQESEQPPSEKQQSESAEAAPKTKE